MNDFGGLKLITLNNGNNNNHKQVLLLQPLTVRDTVQYKATYIDCLPKLGKHWFRMVPTI